MEWRFYSWALRLICALFAANGNHYRNNVVIKSMELTYTFQSFTGRTDWFSVCSVRHQQCIGTFEYSSSSMRIILCWLQNSPFQPLFILQRMFVLSNHLCVCVCVCEHLNTRTLDATINQTYRIYFENKWKSILKHLNENYLHCEHFPIY